MGNYGFRDLKDEYYRLLAIVDYDDWTDEKFAKHLQVGSSTIFRWRRSADWDKIKAARRKTYGAFTVKVDRSLYAAALKGDVAAIKLYYERFDGYTPEARLLLAGKSDEELEQRARERMAQLVTNGNPGRGIAGYLPGTGEAQA